MTATATKTTPAIRRRGEPAWLTGLREAAWGAFLRSEVPDRVSHLWRYTAPERFEPDPEAAGALSTSLALEDTARERLGRLVGPDHGRFEAFNLATFDSVRVLRVPAGEVRTDPVDLRLDLAGRGPLVVDRILLLVEDGAEVDLVSGVRGGGDEDRLVHQVVEVFAGAGTKTEVSTVLSEGGGARIFLTQRARLERDAKLLQTIASLGGATVKVDTGSVLAGPGAEASLFGFAFGEGRQHLDHHTVHEHLVPHTLSNLDFKVVLKDRARSAYTGNITIARGASGTEAYQENRNLLLNKGPRAESIPELEILTDDVRCSHGSTTGPIDEEQVLYLQTRGIGREEAVRLIVGGFLAPTLERLPEDLADRLRTEAEKKLGRSG
jgi:Fe-S cluster assembly protein SufD